MQCTQCRRAWHRGCAGLPDLAYAGGLFTCAPCVAATAGPGAAVPGLATGLVQLQGRAVAEASEQTYASRCNSYRRFCVEQLGLQPAEALPEAIGADLDTTRVALYITWASQHKRPPLAASTVAGVLAALASWQRSRGVPEADRITRNRGICALSGQAYPGGKGPSAAGAAVKAPLPVSLLRLLLGSLEVWASQRPAEAAAFRRDAAWLTAGFFALLRRGELAGLRVGDVSEMAGGVGLLISRSKTDQGGAGAVVCLPEETGSRVRAAAAVRQAVADRRAAGASLSDPLFAFTARGAAAKDAFTDRLRQLLRDVGTAEPDLGIQPHLLAAHSLRRGGAVAALEAGASLDELMRHGRWKSNAVEAYLQLSAKARMAIGRRM